MKYSTKDGVKRTIQNEVKASIGDPTPSVIFHIHLLCS